ncbi:MAG: dihydrodipicolinate reductase, partial [Planctomycetota bacterium]
MTTPVLIAGLPGRMAAETAELVADAEGFALLPQAITSPAHDSQSAAIGSQTLALVGNDRLAELDLPAGTMAIDYTTPDAALANVAWYAAHDLPFVMGTTGFDAAEARRLVEESGVSAVIAPNMAVPIVLLQAAGRYLATEFPGALAGAEHTIRESHQATKRDTSGTARAMLGPLNSLGLPGDEAGIEKVRDPQRQRDELGVPEQHLGGHAFHRY